MWNFLPQLVFSVSKEYNVHSFKCNQHHCCFSVGSNNFVIISFYLNLSRKRIAHVCGYPTEIFDISAPLHFLHEFQP